MARTLNPRGRVAGPSLGVSMLLTLTFAGCAAATYPEPVPDDSPGRAVAASAPLEPGDALRVSFGLEPDLDGEYRVDDIGAVPLPLLGNRTVTDMPASLLRRRLIEEYGRRLHNQSIEVVPLRRVRVLGAVQKPGLYHVDPTMSLGDVVALAGGASHEGTIEEIKVVREGVEVRSSLKAGQASPATLRSGDQILVPQKGWFARHSGVVVGSLVSAVSLALTLAF